MGHSQSRPSRPGQQPQQEQLLQGQQQQQPIPQQQQQQQGHTGYAPSAVYHPPPAPYGGYANQGQYYGGFHAAPGPYVSPSCPCTPCVASMHLPACLHATWAAGVFSVSLFRLMQGGGQYAGPHTVYQPSPAAHPPRPQVTTHAVRQTQTIKNQVNLM